MCCLLRGHRWALLHAYTLACVSLTVLDYLKSTPSPSFCFPLGLGYQQFHFLITTKEILALRMWCTPSFCCDVSGFIVYSCFFPALDVTHIKEHLSLSRISGVL